ncbi:MAG: 30S ribosomal protein S15 [Chloroflexi bacterium]|nr:30S ribosomal protein S15 [Chloroflexota bacterium]
MNLAGPNKQRVIQELQTHEGDTGSTQVQIGILTTRIAHLTEHLKVHKHDHHSRRGLLGLVGRRGSLLRYLRGRDAEKYKEVVRHLKLRG